MALTTSSGLSGWVVRLAKARFTISPSGQGWTEQTIHAFNGNEGEYPIGGLIRDSSGNIYGTTGYGGSGSGGAAFELIPPGNGWSFSLLYSFSVSGIGVEDKLLRDAAGNLYETKYMGESGLGAVFELTNGSWMYMPLWNFTVGDGAYPVSSLVFRSDGNLYGTASGGGVGTCSMGCGVVFMVTP